MRDAGGYGNVFLDPNAPPAERWKYVSGRNHETIFLYWSADGWNFTRGETAVIPLAPTGFGVEYPVAFQPDPVADLPGVDMYVPKAIKHLWAPDAYVAFPTMFFHYDSSPIAVA